MTIQFSPQRNPRVIIIQKLYGKLYNNEENISFPKHRFKKFIKDIVNGTLEREELINAEIDNHLNQDFKIKNMDKVFQIIIKSAIFEFLYKPNTSIKIIINEYLKASNFFIDDSQTKYLNALLDKISKKLELAMNEFALIQKYFKKLTYNNPSALNLNDDVFFLTKKITLLFLLILMLKVFIFLDFRNPDLVIKKIVRSSISDLYCKRCKTKIYFYWC